MIGNVQTPTQVTLVDANATSTMCVDVGLTVDAAASSVVVAAFSDESNAVVRFDLKTPEPLSFGVAAGGPSVKEVPELPDSERIRRP